MTEVRARPGCQKPLNGTAVTLPEDGRDPEKRPEFCSTDCAVEERFRRKYAARAAAD